MRKFVMALATVAVMAGASLIGSAQAAPVGLLDGERTVIGGSNMIVDVRNAWGGKNYCWYGDGWNGAGWYQCGYGWRRGYGWGGPYSWHGWGSHMMGGNQMMWGNHMGGRHHHMMGW